MDRRTGPLRAAVLLVVVLGAALLIHRALAGPILGLNVGDVAPDFTLRTTAGRTVALRNLRGRPVIVNFWASWCGPCKAELPALQRIHEAWGDRAVVLGVDLTVEEAGRKVPADFIEKEGVTYPIAMDTTGRVAVQYQVTAIPTSFVLNGKGVIVRVIPHATDYAGFEAALRAASR